MNAMRATDDAREMYLSLFWVFDPGTYTSAAAAVTAHALLAVIVCILASAAVTAGLLSAAAATTGVAVRMSVWSVLCAAFSALAVTVLFGLAALD